MTVVRTACGTAAALGLQTAHSRVLQLLRHPESATRQAAIRALGSLWKLEDFAIVLAVFLAEPLQQHRVGAGAAESQVGSREETRHGHRAKDHPVSVV
jgi:hypothetical protein